jgi:hypothetical protein
MRARIMCLSSEGSASLVKVTDPKGREATVKVFGDGSRSVRQGAPWVVENLFRGGSKASDKQLFQTAIQESRLTGEPVEIC